MVIVKLYGGLGNQMFQYAAARAVALRTKQELFIDTSWFEVKKDTGMSRKYELGLFKVSPKKFDTTGMYIEPIGLGRRGTIPLAIKNIGKKKLRCFTEDHFGFNQKVLDAPRDCCLDGYWQSEKYFIDVRDAILKDLVWRVKPAGKSKKMHEKILKDDSSVSLHIRRGDYVSDKSTNAFHGVLPLSYYLAAEQEIRKNIEKPTFYVFSDDIDWAKKNLKLKSAVRYVDIMNSGGLDMLLMKTCRHNVIANSSFSWWAAWLNTNKRKVVIAPKKWFQETGMNTVDIIPEGWIKL